MTNLSHPIIHSNQKPMFILSMISCLWSPSRFLKTMGLFSTLWVGPKPIFKPLTWCMRYLEEFVFNSISLLYIFNFKKLYFLFKISIFQWQVLFRWYFSPMLSLFFNDLFQCLAHLFRDEYLFERWMIRLNLPARISLLSKRLFVCIVKKLFERWMIRRILAHVDNTTAPNGKAGSQNVSQFSNLHCHYVLIFYPTLFFSGSQWTQYIRPLDAETWYFFSLSVQVIFGEMGSWS